MLDTIKKYFAFGGSFAGHLKRGMAWSVLNSFFEAWQMMAFAVVLFALADGTLSEATMWTALAIMLGSIAGCFVTSHFKSENFCKGNFSMTGEKRLQIGDRMRYLPMGYFNENSLGAISGTMTNTLDDVQNAEGLQVAEHHVGPRAALAVRGVGGDGEVGRVAALAGGGRHDGHHLVGVAGGGADAHARGAQLGHRVQHVGLRLGEAGEDGQQLALEQGVQGLRVVLVGPLAVHALPCGGDALHAQHLPDVVDFQHAHGRARFLHRGLHAVVLEHVGERLHGREAPVIDRRARPVEDDRFNHATPPCASLRRTRRGCSSR